METGECSEEYFICIFYSYNSNIIIIIIIIRLFSFCTYYFKQFIVFLFHFFLPGCEHYRWNSIHVHCIRFELWLNFI